VLAPGLEAALGATQHVHQPALADGQAEQVGKRRLQPLVGQRLKGLEVGRQRVQARSERGACRGRRRRSHDPRAAARALHRQTAVVLDLSP